MRAPLAIGLLVLMIGTGARADDDHVWDFEVRLDGKPIGSHRFSLSAAAGGERVLRSQAELQVKFLGLVAYRYQHDDTEHWRGECLTAMSSSTLDDGKPTRVKATGDAEGLRIEAEGKPAQTLPGCAMSFAYWNPALRTRLPTQLVNAQNGRIENVQLTRLPDGEFESVCGMPAQAAQHWRISGAQTPIDLWYAADGDWLGLDSTVRGGRQLRYRKRCST